MMFNRGGELFKQETLKARNINDTLARLGGYFGRFWYMLLVVMVLITISTWTQVIVPELTGQATDCFLVPLGSQSGSFGNFLGQNQSQNSASACWLGETDSSNLSFTRGLIYTAYTWNHYPAPTDPASMTNDQRIAGLFRLIMIVIGLFVTGSIVTGITFFLMTWTGQHVLRELRLLTRAPPARRDGS